MTCLKMAEDTTIEVASHSTMIATGMTGIVIAIAIETAIETAIDESARTTMIAIEIVTDGEEMKIREGGRA
jgi:hypothetical protein